MFMVCRDDPVVRGCRNRAVLHHREGASLATGDSRSRCNAITQLNAATQLADLRSPPSNRLEALRGDRKGQWSIRINDQWRVCFRFAAGDAFDVVIVDYH